MHTTSMASISSQDRRKSLFGALRERFGATKVAKTEPRTPKSGPRATQGLPKRAFWGSKPKKIHRIAKTTLQAVGVGGYAEAGGGVRGGKLPEFGGSGGYLERFAPVVNDGCGGLSSLRATAAPSWEFDVGGTSLQASFCHDFAGSRHVFAAF